MSTPIRKRTTWAADRNASAPPATPGYGTEDQDHPAHQPDPAQAAYAKGDPDAWAETPKAPPYPQGNPPATPGYDVEDKDHPAHEDPARNPKNARSLKAAVMRKAAKAVAVARSMMGKTANEDQIEEQALDLMDMPDEALQATFDRLSGDFLAEEEVPSEVAADPLDEVQSCGDMAIQGQDPLDALLAQGDVPEEGKKSELDDVMAQMETLLAKVKGMKSADQNDPKGPTLAPKPKSEEEAKKTASRKRIASMLRAADTDGDGFIMKADWQGNPRIFMALDTDNDDILALDEALQACGEEPMAQDELLSPEDEMLLAEMEQKACKAAKKSEDDEEVDDEADEPKEAKKGKKAKKSEDEDDEVEEPDAKESEDDEAEEPKEAKKAKKAKKSEDDEEVDAEDEEPKEAKKGKKAKKSEDEDEAEGDEPEEGDDEPEVKEGKGKKAVADMTFATSGDPMGLGDTPVLTENDSLLRAIFGAEDDEEVEVDDEADEPKEAKKGKKAKKSEDEDDEAEEPDAKESEDDEAEEPKEAKKGKKAKKSDEEDDEAEEPKEAKKAKKSDDDEDADDIEFEAADEDEAEEPKEAKKASKTASQRPQPRKPSTGVKRLGAVAKTASGASEIDNLSSLWASDPDVSEVFGVPSSKNS